MRDRVEHERPDDSVAVAGFEAIVESAGIGFCQWVAAEFAESAAGIVQAEAEAAKTRIGIRV